MAYQLFVTAMGTDHPAFPYETLQEALDTVDKAMEARMFRFSGKDGCGVAIQLGVGTVLRVRSDKLIIREVGEEEEMKRNPLKVRATESEEPFMLIVQLGRAQLPAVGFPSTEAIAELVEGAVESGVFRHVFEEEHDYLFLFSGPGIVYITVTAEDYVTQRRALVEARVRAAQIQAQKQGVGQPAGKGVILTG
jgi:hypothetical protein